MKKQTTPVNADGFNSEAKFQFAKEISRQRHLAMPLFDMETSNL